MPVSLLDGQEDGVDRAVAAGHLGARASRSPRREAQRDLGDLRRCRWSRGTTRATSSSASGVDLLLDQGGDVGVVDFLLLVGQELELLEDAC